MAASSSSIPVIIISSPSSDSSRTATDSDLDIQDKAETLIKAMQSSGLRPPSRPTHDVNLIIKFRYADPKHKQLTIQPMTQLLDFHTPPEQILQIIDEKCTQARHNGKTFAAAYKDAHPDSILTMASVKNGDEGDKFLSDRETFLRFERVGDMLFHHRSKTMNISVLVHRRASVEREEQEVTTSQAGYKFVFNPEDQTTTFLGRARPNNTTTTTTTIPPIPPIPPKLHKKSPSLPTKTTTTRPTYIHHRLATLPEYLPTNNPYPQLHWGIFQRYNPSRPTHLSTVKLLEYHFPPSFSSSPHPLGNLSQATPVAFGTQAEIATSPHPKKIFLSTSKERNKEIWTMPPDEFREERYRGLSQGEFYEVLFENLRPENRERVFLESGREEMYPEPRVPKMTFREYNSMKTEKEMFRGEVHLLIRFVNQLRSRGSIPPRFPRSFPLPAEVVVSVGGDFSTMGGMQAIRRGLMEGLEEWCERQAGEDVWGTWWLFDREGGLWGRWHLELWIRPLLGVEGRDEEEALLYRMGGEDFVGMFVDEGVAREVVGRGEKVLLYMEAHLVP
ncbi:uncharacterized protein RCC_11061 [Ramularia collo-cygni]|uniref:Uncharacterized protein n=1 Tax=Ramularia collo-cygni TaxID=112498 RepID=A0A2D3VB71_9PEZI|nr:uncharacterized protein RCC_11061 [Ramularia collo-cygni]CZT25333.1 uncharacterized protein RCC_11061 [Ramularia collo-cygni]